MLADSIDRWNRQIREEDAWKGFRKHVKKDSRRGGPEWCFTSFA